MKHPFGLFFSCFIAIIPLTGLATSKAPPPASATLTKPDIAKSTSKHEEFRFYLTGNSGELKPMANHQCLLTISGSAVKDIIYKATKPVPTLTNVPLSEFVKYWSAGEIFNKDHPNAGLIATTQADGKVNVAYVLILNSSQYNGGDQISFTCTLLSNQKFDRVIKFYHPTVVLGG